ncbi:MAG: iron-containing alcohol dehydrogenase [Rhodocyclaceae bacterium]|nr:iron-containing alcohol dehydrogenase [Rhodocyclaceae bacterium]MBK6909189.1 iron-containing alcohol dehydrogenase [Rhodocyclaceae bacterium]
MSVISKIRVAINGFALPLINFPKPFTFVGPDSSLSMCEEIVGLGIKRIIIITDGPLFKLGIANAVVDKLKGAGVEVDVFAEIEPDPGYELVLKGVERVKAFKADAILAIGGGSSIDGAKAVMMCHANDCHPEKLTGIWLYAAPRKRGLPFFAIPTTAGTGSEATIAAVVTNKQEGIKYFIADPKVVPSMAALDPKLMTGLPPFITAPTGMDALTHAVEAYISTMAYAETDELARMATASVMRNLPMAYSDGKNLQARERMAVASCMAGLAFTRAGVGYVHAFAHQMGGLYHVPHGLANAIIMPYVLDFSKPNCAHRLADLARIAGIGAAGNSDEQLADAFIARIRQMNADMQIPTVIKDLKKDDFEKIIERAFTEAHGTYGVPRYLTRDDARAMLAKLMP